jgi:NAD(P)-dependent dehydrogenase (short-subunit alcohol dehydrogenase family)
MGHYPEIANKIVLVTGAVGGLGTSVVRHFHAEGATVICVDNRAGRSAETFSDLDGSRLTYIDNIDVTHPDDVETMCQQAIDTHGRIDVLVNAAGGYRAGDPVHETSLDTFDFLINLNTKSMFLVSGAVAKRMLDVGNDGRIISIGATGGLKGGKNSAAYSASKSALFRIIESMALELKDFGINVNAVYPSIIDTAANREQMPKSDFSKWVTPDSLAGVIAFLASDAAKDITGAAIPVTGRV